MKAKPSAIWNTKRIARGSWGAGTMFAIPFRSPTAGSFRTPWAPCSIRSMSLRRTVHIPPGNYGPSCVYDDRGRRRASKSWILPTSTATQRAFERTLTLAWTQAQVQLHHLGIGTDEAHLFQRLANAVIYPDASLRPASDHLSANQPGYFHAVGLGISGDLPIVLARIDNEEDVDMIRQLLRAHEYWRMKHLSADVVIVNEKPPSYKQDFQGSLEALVHGSQLRLSPDTGNTRGRIFLLRGDLITPQTRAQLQSVARVLFLAGAALLPSKLAGRRLDGEREPQLRRRGGERESRKRPDVPLPRIEFGIFQWHRRL